jgi:lipid II isoglutaminyl synthase (glutamine-hydrolysing)
VQLGGRDLSILLVKNPAGANEVLRTLTLEPGEHDVFAVLNDNVADGRDVSWIWDADFEVLADRVRRVTCSGTRAAEMAVRMKYAGVPLGRIVVHDDLPAGLDAAVADGIGPLYALPTYTAMLALRAELVERGAARGSFA